MSDILSSAPDKYKNDYITYAKGDFKFIENKIKKELECPNEELKVTCQHHFDSAGKYIRPTITMLMSQACNVDHSEINKSQMELAMIVEMIHTSSLVHDDVIDSSEVRRGKKTAQSIWGQKKAILAGNYILNTASRKLAKIGNTEVISVLSQVLEDLVAGEFMQMGSKESESERFNHYLTKTYKKTASLIANSCKAAAILSDSAHDLREAAFQYGKNAGIAFQLIDDFLDFTATQSSMGKPVCADLRLGLATAPVLYASMQHPELNALIMRRFSEDGDVESAREMVNQSQGVQQTLFLATQHCKEAIRHLAVVERDGVGGSGGVCRQEEFDGRVGSVVVDGGVDGVQINGGVGFDAGSFSSDLKKKNSHSSLGLCGMEVDGLVDDGRVVGGLDKEGRVIEGLENGGRVGDGGRGVGFEASAARNSLIRMTQGIISRTK